MLSVLSKTGNYIASRGCLKTALIENLVKDLYVDSRLVCSAVLYYIIILLLN